MNYEINFLILQSQTENLDEIRQKVQELIKKYDGKITDELIYQKRKLAYEIKHERYGFYTVYRFDLEDGTVLKDLTKDLNLLSEVARYIIVRSDELPKLEKNIGQKKETTSEKETAPVKERKDKILSEIDKETDQKTTPSTDKSTTSAKKENTVTKDENTKPTEEKTTESKEEKKQPSAKKNVKKSTDEKEISMEDLDKKLDEILDI